MSRVGLCKSATASKLQRFRPASTCTSAAHVHYISTTSSDCATPHAAAGTPLASSWLHQAAVASATPLQPLQASARVALCPTLPHAGSILSHLLPGLHHSLHSCVELPQHQLHCLGARGSQTQLAGPLRCLDLDIQAIGVAFGGRALVCWQPLDDALILEALQVLRGRATCRAAACACFGDAG